jgi:hypothetical protein
LLFEHATYRLDISHSPETQEVISGYGHMIANKLHSFTPGDPLQPVVYVHDQIVAKTDYVCVGGTMDVSLSTLTSKDLIRNRFSGYRHYRQLQPDEELMILTPTTTVVCKYHGFYGGLNIKGDLQEPLIVRDYMYTHKLLDQCALNPINQRDRVHDGDSGSPVVDTSGNLVGLMHSSNGQFEDCVVWFTPFTNIYSFLLSDYNATEVNIL